VPDAIGFELVEHDPDLLDRTGLTDMHGDPEAEPSGALE
jgi:hypothetical protein